MYSFILVIHLFVCIAIILIIISQSSKGSEMGAVFGGGASQTAFGSQGPGSFLEKLTTVFAVVFMVTSLSLAYLSTNRVSHKEGPAGPPPVQMPVQEGQMPVQEGQAPAQQGQSPSQAGQGQSQPAPSPPPEMPPPAE
ncbi:MAG: preprotein translocase subunit SecG [bacterium]